MSTETIDLSGGWDLLWTRVSVDMPAGMSNLMLLAGTGLVVFAILKWVWARQHGRGVRSAGLAWTLLVGAILAAPGVIVPIIMAGVDVVLNTALSAAGA